MVVLLLISSFVLIFVSGFLYVKKFGIKAQGNSLKAKSLENLYCEPEAAVTEVDKG